MLTPGVDSVSCSDNMSKAVLIIGFGSNKPDTQRAMMDAVTKLGSSIGGLYHAFVGGDEPTIGSALRKMDEDGVDDVTVIPFLSAAGEISMRYIPRHLSIKDTPGTYELSYPAGMTVHYMRPLGEDPGISDLIHKRIIDMDIEDATTGIMLITHGSQYRYNSQMAQAHAERLMRMGHKHVLTAFMDHNEPTVDGCESFMAGRGASKIIAVPLMMGADADYRENIPEALGIGKNAVSGTAVISGYEVDIYLTAPIGTDDGIADVIRHIVSSV